MYHILKLHIVEREARGR